MASAGRIGEAFTLRIGLHDSPDLCGAKAYSAFGGRLAKTTVSLSNNGFTLFFDKKHQGEADGKE